MESLFELLGCVAVGTGGGCRAYRVELPPRSRTGRPGGHVLVTDGGGCGVPAGGRTLVGRYDEAGEPVWCAELATEVEAVRVVSDLLY